MSPFGYLISWANCLDLDETPSNSSFDSDPSCLLTPTLSFAAILNSFLWGGGEIERDSKLNVIDVYM